MQVGVHWRIHEGLVPDRKTELDLLLRSFGDNVQWVRGGRRELAPPEQFGSRSSPALALTTIQDARALDGTWEVTPGLYFHQRKYDVSYWLPRLAFDIPVLNRGCIFTPIGLLRWMPSEIISGDHLFLRPDSGLKTFPGLTFDVGRETPLLSLFNQLTATYKGLPPELMVCVARACRIHPIEWRFWIVDRKVVASTPYSWNDEAMVWKEPPYAATRVAMQMASNLWQPDVAYVCDVVEQVVDGVQFHLNELNALSTSGLYRVPFEPLISSLRSVVMREASGEVMLED